MKTNLKKFSIVIAAVMTASTLAVSASAANGASLIADADFYLNFENGIADVQGNYEVVSEGDTPIVEGKFGSGAQTVADVNYLSVPDMTFGAESFTISTWIKFNTHTDDPVLFGNKWWDNGKNPGWLLCVRDEDFRFNGSSEPSGNTRTDAYYPYVVTPGEWMHVALSVDAETASYKYYINGVLQTEEDGENVITFTYADGGAWDPEPGIYCFNIGEDGTGMYNADMEYDAVYDELAIFKSALTDSEIAALYAYVPGQEAPAEIPDEAPVDTPAASETVETTEPATAPQTFDITVLGIVSVILSLSGVTIFKKRK